MHVADSVFGADAVFNDGAAHDAHERHGALPERVAADLRKVRRVGAFVVNHLAEHGRVFVCKGLKAREDFIERPRDLLKPVEGGNGDKLYGGRFARTGELGNHHRLLFAFAEVKRQGRARVAPRGVSRKALRAVQVPQREIVDLLGEDVGRNLPEASDVEAALFSAAVAVRGKKVPGGNERNVVSAAVFAQCERSVDCLAVVPARAFNHLAVLLLVGFVLDALSDVGFPQEGNRGHHRLGLARSVAQEKRFASRVGERLANHRDADGREEPLRGVQKRGRVVVAARDHDVPAVGLAPYGGEKVVVEVLRKVRGRGVVKDVASDHQAVDVSFGDELAKPVKKLLKRVVAPGAVKRPPQVQVRGVKNAHEKNKSKWVTMAALFR